MGLAPEKDTTVDSTPTRQGPPSRISGMRPAISSHTSWAQVGLGRPEAFALGAATGTPERRISACATGCPGQRTATVSRPAVTVRGTASAAGSTQVSGPGQKASMARRAVPGTDRASSSSIP